MKSAAQHVACFNFLLFCSYHHHYSLDYFLMQFGSSASDGGIIYSINIVFFIFCVTFVRPIGFQDQNIAFEVIVVTRNVKLHQNRLDNLKSSTVVDDRHT